MKTLLTLAIAAVATLAATTTRAEAGHRGHRHDSCTRVVYSSCGCPIYQERYIAYRERCGSPVYRYRTVSVRHRCRPRYVEPCHDRGYGYYNGGYARHRGPGVVISARF